MDLIDFAMHWAGAVFKETLPAPLLSLVYDHLLDPRSPAQHLRRHVSSVFFITMSQLAGLLAPIVDRVSAALAASPDLVILVFLAVLLLFFVQLLAYIQRVMLFWTRLAFRMVFYTGVVLFGAIVWQRGVLESMNDLVVLSSKVVGFVVGVGDVFVKEYRRYEQMERTRKQTEAWDSRGKRGW